MSDIVSTLTIPSRTDMHHQEILGLLDQLEKREEQSGMKHAGLGHRLITKGPRTLQDDAYRLGSSTKEFDTILHILQNVRLLCLCLCVFMTNLLITILRFLST